MLSRRTARISRISAQPIYCRSLRISYWPLQYLQSGSSLIGGAYGSYCPFDHDKLWIRFFGRLGTARHFSRPIFCSGTRCAHQFWPQCARSAASAGARLAAGPAAGQAARARARIQPKSPRASSQISEFRSCMHSVSWIHARAGGCVAAHAILWARLPETQNAAGRPIALRNLVSANSSAPGG